MKKTITLLFFFLVTILMATESFANSNASNPNFEDSLVCSTAMISYAGNPFCTSETIPQVVTLTGTGAYTGGTFSSIQPGVAINAITGDIALPFCTPGFYDITYTIPANGGCPAITVTTNISINVPANAGGDGVTTVSDNNIVVNLADLISGEQANGVWTRDSGTGGTFDAVMGTFTTAIGTTTSTFTYEITATIACTTGDTSVATINVMPPPMPIIVDGAIGVEDVTANVVQPYILDTGLGNANYSFVWYLGGIIIPGATGSIFTATQAGTYCVLATNNLTGDTSNLVCATVTTVVLNTNEFNTIHLIYSPNPVTDVLTIQSNEIIKKATVFNTLGQTVYVNHFNDLEPQLALSHLVSGNYFIKIESDGNQKVFKIIKK